MALTFGDNISYQGKKPLDARSLFKTIADMKNYSENYLPSLAICQNEEDGKLYEYNVNNNVDPITGKWRVFESGSGEDGVKIDDTAPSTETVYSSEKVEELVEENALENKETLEKISEKNGVITYNNTILSNNVFAGGWDNYNEEEIVIGRYINGKPVYRKIIKYTGEITATSSNLVSHNINNLESVISFKAQAKISEEFISTDSVGTSGKSSDTQTGFRVTNSYIVNVGKNTFPSSTWYFCIEYTKTTDAENSFNPTLLKSMSTVGFENYSEEETIVGRWIDGRPIYRRLVIQKKATNASNTQYIKLSTLANFESTFKVTDIISTCKSFIINTVSKDIIQVGTYRSSNYAFVEYTSLSTGTDALAYFLNGWEGDIYWVLEYVKSTDEPNSFSLDMFRSQVSAEIGGGGSIDITLTEEERKEMMDVIFGGTD